MKIKHNAVIAFLAAQHGCKEEHIQLSHMHYSEEHGDTFEYTIVDGFPDPVAGYVPALVTLKFGEIHRNSGPAGDESYALS